MKTIHDIVDAINAAIPINGRDMYGIATPAVRVDQMLPAIGEVYIGIDDSYPIRVYHKLNGMTSLIRPGSGFGDSTGDQVNVYQMSMIVFNNQRLTKIKPDQLVLLMQVNTPRAVKSDYFKTIRITYNNVILNNAQVWAQEYGATTYRLGLMQNLFQINYTVEATFKEGCFAKCPEDFTSQN